MREIKHRRCHLVPQKQKYVDDAAGCAHDRENAGCESQDMESIIENGGFCF
jgi:hypothetical protein